ncbi:MAG: DNA adenine methylase [Candidatus Methanomethylicaceae archaeon]
MREQRCIAPYYGGKARLAQEIVKLIPRHLIYVEPFCGMASVLVNKPCPTLEGHNWYQEIINDVDDNIVNFFNVLKDRELTEELMYRLRFTLHARSEYRAAENILNNADQHSPVDRAWALFTCLCLGHGAKMRHGYAGLTKYPGGHGRTPLKFLTKVEALPFFVQRLKYVRVENMDALELIRRIDSEGTFFFCDPPYIGTVCNGYTHHYSEQDFAELVETLEAAKGSFILTILENELTRKYFRKHWERFEVVDANTMECSSPEKRRMHLIFRHIKPVRDKRTMKMLEHGALSVFDAWREQARLL